MANKKHLEILLQGVEAWNRWRKKNPSVRPNLSNITVHQDEIRGTKLSAKFGRANLVHANLSHANLRNAVFFNAHMMEADLSHANISGASFGQAILEGANFYKANHGVRDPGMTNFAGANLRHANLQHAVLPFVIMHNANVQQADLSHARLVNGAFYDSEFHVTRFEHADLRRADFTNANLRWARMQNANLESAHLTSALLIGTDLRNAILTDCSVYGVSTWEVKLDGAKQQNLKITEGYGSGILVDNIQVAQFVHLILNNDTIREVINTLTSKTVLILGRFSPPERKKVLDELRKNLRKYDLVPIVFDFDRPTDKDFTETIKTLASLSYFVIADVTNPKSSPLELQATVPDYQIPFVPIIQEGESPFAMMADLQKKYNWVLDTLEYDSVERLIKALKPAIIDPAIEKHNELRLIKARQPKIRSAKDFLGK